MEAGQWPGGVAGALLHPCRPVDVEIQNAIEAIAGEHAIMVTWFEVRGLLGGRLASLAGQPDDPLRR
jgi:hypothetical protein